MSGLLLDTHVWLWFAIGEESKLNVAARNRIDQAAKLGKLYLSIISIWETGMLQSKQRIYLPHPYKAWINAAIKAPGLRLLPLEPSIALNCNDLPGEFHPDPADRIIVASARYLSIPLMTHDRKIIAYARQGHVIVDAV